MHSAAAALASTWSLLGAHAAASLGCRATRMCRRRSGLRAVRFLAALAVLAMGLGSPARAEGAEAPSPPRPGPELYRTHCAPCHGADGAGDPAAREGLPVALPDLSDCAFAQREADADWLAVVHQGGPARGFSPLMPRFGSALSDAEIELVLAHVRRFCEGSPWPRGELNLPRPLVTTKAFPEDEALIESAVSVEGPDLAIQQLVYERRIGPRGQVEIALPFGLREQPGGAKRFDIGDVRLGWKHAVFYDLDLGALVSLAGELSLPTGDEDEGFGLGTAAFEPYLVWGQLLPAGFFLQAQAGFELPFDDDRAEESAFWRLSAGRSFAPRRFGRVVTPMFEILGSEVLTAGADTHWDVVPQVQVTLSRRQHVRLAAGARIPLDDAGRRDSQVLLYLLWDWFDGGFFEGW